MRLTNKLISGFLLVAAVAGFAQAQESATDDAAAKGLEIAQERKARDRGWNTSRSEVVMILRNAQGQEATREMKVDTIEVQNDGDKAMTVFQSPRDVSGTAFLSFSHVIEPDEQWIYLPALKRVKRIASRNKSGPFMGSEFAFEDMTSYEVEKFDYEYVGDETLDGQEMFILDQFPKYEFSGYSRQRVWLDKKHYRVHKVEFYDKKDDLLKTLEFNDFKLYKDKFWRPMVSYMYNEQTGKSTELQTESLSFDVGLDESDFDKNSLRRAR